MNTKYVVALTEAEREHLHKLISAGTASARMLNRARIVLRPLGESIPAMAPSPSTGR
jgi:hypothetical protein